MKEREETRTAKKRFTNAAADHGKYTLSANSEACNKAYDRIVAAASELRKESDGGERALSELATHGDVSVRVWAASYLLPLQQEEAVKVLEKIASASGPIAFDANMVLKEWRAGRLRLR